MTKFKSRLIIGLAVLTLTTSAFADTKTDYDQAIQYAKENKKLPPQLLFALLFLKYILI